MRHDDKQYVCKTYGLVSSEFVCYFYIASFWYFSLGAHISFYEPNIEIHLPFGFLRVGWVTGERKRRYRWVWGETFEQRRKVIEQEQYNC